MFDLEKFKTGKYYVHLPTRELYIEAMQFLDAVGMRWRFGTHLLNLDVWEIDEEETIILYFGGDEIVQDELEKALSYEEKKEKLNINGTGVVGEDWVTRDDRHILKKEQISDMVKSPNHYIGELGLEVEYVLRNFIPRYEDSYVAHRIASALEYLLRSPLKNGKQDLEKARYNITQALEHMDKNE